MTERWNQQTKILKIAIADMFKYLNKYMNTMMREMVDIKKELKGTSRGENISEMKVLLHGINSRYILKNF